MTDAPLNFLSEEERRKWIIEHAEYFTVIRRLNMKYERTEYQTLKGARQAAKNNLRKQPGSRFMIYAICDGRDTWVENIA